MSIGVTAVEVNRKQSKVAVTGHVDTKKVIKKVRSIGKRAEPWPYVEYNLVYYPYAAQAYDKKAPTGYVRNVPQALPNPGAPEERYTTLFSDENVNACSIMWWTGFSLFSLLFNGLVYQWIWVDDWPTCTMSFEIAIEVTTEWKLLQQIFGNVQLRMMEKGMIKT